MEVNLIMGSHNLQKQNRNTGMEAIRLALIEGEKSGVSSQTPEDIRKEVQERLSKDGSLS